MPKPETGTAAPEGTAIPTNIDYDRVSNASQKSLLAVAHLHARLFRHALEVNAELLDFARKRVGEDLRTNQDLARCRNVTDAVEVMSGFYQKAFEEYAAEADRIVRISADVAKRAIDETREETDEIARG